jgi:protein ImuA
MTGLHEIIGDTPADFAAAQAFALSAAIQNGRAQRPLFFGTLARASQERGTLYGAGLHHFGLDPGRVLLFAGPSEKALLWAAEEAANCPALGGVIIVLGQREKLYGFTASRRLKLRQQRSGVPLFLVRTMADEPTAATTRWRIAFTPSQGLMAPSAPAPLLGIPRFRVLLERYAGMPPRQWEVELDETHTLRVAAPVSHRPAYHRPAAQERAA